MCGSDHYKEGDSLKVPRFLKFFMAIFVCIALIRAVNGAGEFSLSSVLLDLQNFDFDFSAVKELVAFFRDGTFLDGFVSWNGALTGFEGFFINIRNVVTSFFATIGSLLRVVVRGCWNIFVQTFRLFGEFFSLFLSVLGYT